MTAEILSRQQASCECIMNKLSLALALVIAPLAGEAGAAASDPFGSQPASHPIKKPTPVAVLFEADDRVLTSADFEKKMGRAIGILTIGVLRETGAAPGTQHSLAMARDTRPTTSFTSLSFGYMISPLNSVAAMASYGKTDGIGSPDSLLAQVSSVRTVAFSMGYARRELFTSNDRLAVTLSVPAKVRAGSLGNSGPALQASEPGAPRFGAPTLNLRPTATERDLEFGYTRMFGRQSRLTGAVMLRVNPGHDANARPDWLTGARYSYGF
jgi:hypothetical protein